MNTIDQQLLSEKIRLLNRRDILPEEFFSFMVEIVEVYFEYRFARFLGGRRYLLARRLRHSKRASQKM